MPFRTQSSGSGRVSTLTSEPRQAGTARLCDSTVELSNRNCLDSKAARPAGCSHHNRAIQPLPHETGAFGKSEHSPTWTIWRQPNSASRWSAKTLARTFLSGHRIDLLLKPGPHFQIAWARTTQQTTTPDISSTIMLFMTEPLLGDGSGPWPLGLLHF